MYETQLQIDKRDSKLCKRTKNLIEDTVVCLINCIDIIKI